MSRIWIHFGFLLLCLPGVMLAFHSSACVLADENSDREQMKEQISQLISQLDSNQRTVRQRAEIKLVGLGKPVLSLLPPPELLSSNSVKEALQRVRLQIEKRAAIDSVKATFIKLKGKYSLQKILFEMTKQSGNQFDTTKLPESVLAKMIEVNYEDTSFWKTIDDLTRKYALSYQFNDSNGALEFHQDRRNQQKSALEKKRVCYNGPFRITIENLHRRPVTGSVKRELLRATFLIQVEPRLRPLFLNYASRDIEARDPLNQRLLPFSPDARYELPLGEGGKGLKFTMNWIVDKTQIPGTIQIEGHLKLELAAETLPISFDNLIQSKGAIRRRGNISVKLIEAEKIKNNATSELNIRIAISYDFGGPAFESHRTWIYHNRAYLQDPQGMKYWLNGSSQTTLENAGKISVLYQFTGLPRTESHYQFTYLAPTVITSAAIKFQFEKIPFPDQTSRPE